MLGIRDIGVRVVPVKLIFLHYFAEACGEFLHSLGATKDYACHFHMAICQPILVEKVTVERFFCFREIDSVLDGQDIVLVPGRAVWMVLEELT